MQVASQSWYIPTVPVDPAVFVKCHGSRCCFHGHPASNTNCLVAPLTPTSLTVLVQSSGERLFLSFPSLPLFLYHYPSLFLSLPHLSVSLFFNIVTACHNNTKKNKVWMRDKGDLIWVLKVVEGSMGTAPPIDPPAHPATIPLLPPYSCHQSLKLSVVLRGPTSHSLT